LADEKGRSDGNMRSSLLVLALACMLLFPVPAVSQPSQDGPGN
jgi:hypothetical protein